MKEMEITRSTERPSCLHTIEIVIIIMLCNVKGTLVDQGNVDQGIEQRNIHHANTTYIWTYTLKTTYTNYGMNWLHGDVDQKNMDKREQR